MISAVQELTAESMQARVISVLEASASATPGRRLRGRRPDRIASFDPRATFLVAGAGVVIVALAAAVFLGSGWEGVSDNSSGDPLTPADEVMVQLRPRATRQPKLEAEAGSRPEGATSKEESK